MLSRRVRSSLIALVTASVAVALVPATAWTAPALAASVVQPDTGPFATPPNPDWPLTRTSTTPPAGLSAPGQGSTTGRVGAAGKQPVGASALTSSVIGPQSDTWSFSVNPTTLECSTASSLRHNAWNSYYNFGYCGTFLQVDAVMYGMNVTNMGFEPNSAVPLPYTLVSRTQTGISLTTVVDAGTTGIRLTQVDTYNTAADGWITDLRVQNLGSATHTVNAMHISGECSYWDGTNAVSTVYDAVSGQVSCVNGLNTVTYIRRVPGAGVYNGNGDVWGHGLTAVLAPGDNMAFSGELVWHKDGTIPGPPAPLPDWYGTADPLTGAGGRNTDTPTDQCSCVDPVNSATGELWSTVSDLLLPGRSPVEATRTYSSLRASASGLFGRGWSSPWDSHIVAGNPTLIVHDTGSQTAMTANADGTFSPAPDTFATLARDSGTGVYTYVPRNGSTYKYDATGRLTSITDRNGESTSLAWSATTLTITTSDGRALALTRNTDGTVSQMAGPEGRTLLYHYDGSGNLDQVTDARGKVWHFGYDKPGRMTTETSPLQETTTTHYDAAGRVSSQDTPRGGTTTFSYTVSGTATTARVTDPSGVVTDYGYEHGLLVSRTLDPTGAPATWMYTYDLNSDQLTATSPTGERTYAQFDSSGNALTRTDAAGNTTRVTYNAFNEPLTSQDADGYITQWTYDANGNVSTQSTPRNGVASTTVYGRDPVHAADVLTVTDPDLRQTHLGYSGAGLLISSIAPDTGKTTWTRNAYGQPLTQVSPLGNVSGGSPSLYTTSTAYDLGGNVTSITDQLGHMTGYGYDDDSRPTTVTDPYLKVTKTDYFPDGPVKSVTDPLNRVTAYTYDLAAKPLTTLTADNAQTTKTYESHGWLSTLVKPSGNAAGTTAAQKTARTVTSAYDLSGRVTSTSQPDPAHTGQSLSSVTVYDTAGRPAAVTDPAGNTTAYSYDVRNREASVTDPAGKTTYYGYDAFGATTDVTDPLSHVTHTTYTAAGLVASVTNGAGEITSYSFDAAGRVKTTVDPRGTCSGCTAANFTTTYGYDLNGNRTSVADQLNHTTGYTFDRADRLTKVTDAKGHHTDYAYDNDNRLLTVTAPDLGVTTLGYDDAGQHTSTQTPRLKTWTYGYDPTGRLASTTDPLLRKSTQTYTPDGQLATQVTARGNAGVPAAGTITYAYDDAGRLLSTNFGDGATAISYGYDKASRRTSMTDAAGTQVRGYDPDGRLSSVTRGTATWGYTYNDDGTVATATRPDTTVETWTYDLAPRPTKVVIGTAATSFSYDKAGHLLKTTNPNATTETQTWDQAGYLATLITKSGSTNRISQTIKRDVTNNPTQIAVTRGTGSETRSFLYDPNDRLQGVCYVVLTSCTSATTATQWWTYDVNGNRATEKNGTGTGTTTTYIYDNADQLSSRKVGTATAIPLTYDADGNVLTDGSTTWTYDLRNRTTSSKVGTTTTSWQRDGDGNLTQQAAGATSTSYLWDINHTIPQLASTTSGTTTTSYRYDPAARPFSLTSATTTETIGHDLLGAPTDLLSSTGATVRSNDYTPFGTPRTAIGGPATPTGPISAIQYGQLLASGASGTYSAPDRTYDPTTSRWSGLDPVTATVSQPFDSRYAYVGNRPGSYTDRLGDCWFGTNDDGSCRGSDPYDSAVEHLNPLYPVVQAYAAEADAANAGCPLWVVAKLGLKATGTLAFQAAVTYTGGKTLLAGKSIIEQQLARGLTAGTAGIGAAETAGSGAESAVAGRSLARQLASEQQLGEAGTPLAGAGTATKLRAADRLAADYGGEAADWAKMGSSSFRGADGFQFETHWYENVLTGVRTEFKTKFLWLP